MSRTAFGSCARSRPTNRARSRVSGSNGSARTTDSSSTWPTGAGYCSARAAQSHWCGFIRRRRIRPPSRRASGRSRTSSGCELMPEQPHIKRAEESRVEKPWGYELRWAITDRYLGKILHVNRGEALSLQYHERKDECILLSSGVLDLELDGRVHRLPPRDRAD